MTAYGNLSYTTQQFQQEFSQEEAYGEAYVKINNKAEQAQNKAKTAAENMNLGPGGKYYNHPGSALIYLMVYVMGELQGNASQLQFQAASEKINAQNGMSQLINTIQSNVNSPPKTDTPGVSSGTVQIVASETDCMMDLLNPSAGGTQATDLAAALGGSSTTGFLSQNFQKIRSDIYWGTGNGIPTDNEANYNPQAYGPNDIPTPTSGTSYTSYHYIVLPAGTAAGTQPFMVNYTDTKQDLAKQNDAYGSQEAMGIFTNSYNQNISSVQALGPAVNAQVGLMTSDQKTRQSVMTSMLQDLSTLSRISNQNGKPQ